MDMWEATQLVQHNTAIAISKRRKKKTKVTHLLSVPELAQRRKGEENLYCYVEKSMMGEN